ncbi:MAG: hypothetical protein Ct9H90mP8_1350 [Pseudomonadota bacterium]|nr:MAG: hypothetical protein Ct9H90mP8_1350 [Pseudomonadota bacterium]
MDVPAPFSGKVENVLIKVGDKVSEGTPIVDLQTSDDANAEEISIWTRKETLKIWKSSRIQEI